MDTTELRTLLVPLISDLSKGVNEIDFLVVFLGLLATYGILQIFGILFSSLSENSELALRRKDKITSLEDGVARGRTKETKVPAAIESLLSRGNYFSKLSPTDIPENVRASLYETPGGERTLVVECRERFPYGLRALYDALLWTTMALVVGTGIVWLVSLYAPEEYVLGAAVGAVVGIWALMVGRALLVSEKLCFAFSERRVHFLGTWSRRVEQCLTPVHMTVNHGRKGWRSRIWYSTYELGISPYFPEREAAEAYFEAFVNACNWEIGKLVVSFNGFEISCGKSGAMPQQEIETASEVEDTREEEAA